MSNRSGILPLSGFPEAPKDGLQYARRNAAWVQNLSGVTVSATPPPEPLLPGQLWWDSDTGDTYLWYDDGNSKQWVQQNLSQPPVVIADSPPAGAYNGQIWWDSNSGNTYVFYDDGNSRQWVQQNTSVDVSEQSFAVWPSGTLRTMKQRATDTYCILDAPGSPDPTGVNDSTTALKAMVAEGIRCEITRGSFICKETLVMAPGQMIDGFGGGYLWDAHSRILFTGTGAKSYTIPDTASLSVANPDVGAPYLADSGTRGNTYATNNLTTAFSAGIIMAKGSRISNLGIYPTFAGLMAPYKDSASFTIADDWDVGIWASDAEQWALENVNCVGHYRKAGFLASNQTAYVGCQNGHANHCTFGGKFGVSIRVPETAQPNAWGFAGTMFENCIIQSLRHQSLHLATSSMLASSFSSPSGCLEMGGRDASIRGIKFLNSTFIGNDDICMIFSNGSEIMFGGCYMEAQATRVSGGSTGLVGSRMVTIGATAGSFRFDDLTAKFAVDFSPWQVRDGGVTRYPSADGVFNPSYSEDGDRDRIRYATRTGVRLRKAPGHSWGVDTYDAGGGVVDAFTVNSAGDVTARGLLTATLSISGITASVANDTAIDLVPPKLGGWCALTFTGGTENSAFHSASRSGMFFYDVGASSFTTTKIAGGANFICVSTDVTGTTGTAGNVTVGVIDGKVRVENRQGAASVFRYFFFG